MAANLLAEFGTPEQIPALQARVDAEDKGFREAAKSAIAALGSMKMNPADVDTDHTGFRWRRDAFQNASAIERAEQVLADTTGIPATRRDALALLSDHELVANAVIVSADTVWLGIDHGLFGFGRRQRRWSGFAAHGRFDIEVLDLMERDGLLTITNPLGTSPSPQLEPPAITALEGTVCFEAEAASEISYPFELVEMKGASGGCALTLREGVGSEECYDKGDEGFASYRIGLLLNTPFRVWVRAWWNGICRNAVFVKVGELDRIAISTERMHWWHWTCTGSLTAESGDTLTLINREDGICIDQVIVTADTFEPGTDAQRPTLVPPAVNTAEPVVLLNASGAGQTSAAPLDFKSHHSADERVSLPDVRTVVVRGASPAPMTVWLLNGTGWQCSGDFELEQDEAVGFGPQDYEVSADETLIRVDFDFAAADLTCGCHEMNLRVRHDSGRLEGFRIVLDRPFQ